VRVSNVSAAEADEATVLSTVLSRTVNGLAALHALCLRARPRHVAAGAAQPVHERGWPTSHDPRGHDLLLAARHLGRKAEQHRVGIERLALTPRPPAGRPQDRRWSSEDRRARPMLRPTHLVSGHERRHPGRPPDDRIAERRRRARANGCRGCRPSSETSH